MENDVRRGRGRMNLSAWDGYSDEEEAQPARRSRDHGGQSKDAARAYQWAHAPARLTVAERARITDWARQERRRLTLKP